MRALIVDPHAPAHLTLGEAPNPRPAPYQALVKIAAISLNHGELPELSGAATGSIPGWDAAGTVVEAAANGEGPAVGTRVVTWGPNGAWAELRAVDVDKLAPLPPNVDMAAASTIPVAGLTALRALRVVGSVLGKHVLVTGASGGVGRYAVQLGHRAGAYVIAVVGNAQRGAGLRELGADAVVTDLETIQTPLHVVIDNVGGPQLVSAYQRLAPQGILVSIGYASHEPAVFPPYGTVGPGRSILAFGLTSAGGNIADDLGYLVSLIDTHQLDPQIGWQGEWVDAAKAVRLLLERKVAGKAVLQIG